MDIPTIETILLIFYLSPGFIILFIFQRARDINFASNGEFVALGAFLNGLIYGMALLSYSLFTQQLPSPDDLPTLIQTLPFIMVVFFAWLITFLLCVVIYRINIFKVIQKVIKRKGEGGIITRGRDLWDDVFQNFNGYHLIYTIDNKIYFGNVKRISSTGEQKQVYLEEPALLKNFEEISLINELGLPVKSLLFLENDIKRIGFVGKENKKI